MLRSTISKSLSLRSAKHHTWSAVPQGPPDAILGVTEAFKADQNPLKINLGVGAYRDDNNKPFVLPSVKEAEMSVMGKMLDKEYSGITGEAGFQKLAAELAYGQDSKVIKQGKLATSQTISGTGALRIGGAFISRFFKGAGGKKIYLPTPSWGNHTPIFKDAGLEVGAYKYFDKKTSGLDFKGMMEDLMKIPDESAVLFHGTWDFNHRYTYSNIACAHNPTGVDPSPEQWQELSNLAKEKKFLPFFDMAYQGFASGDCDRDAFPVRLFVQGNIILTLDGHQIILSQSFSKNMGLYGERVGLLSVVTDSVEETMRVDSQIKIIIRPMYSNPPISGPRIVKEILANLELNKQWFLDLI